MNISIPTPSTTTATTVVRTLLVSGLVVGLSVLTACGARESAEVIPAADNTVASSGPTDSETSTIPPASIIPPASTSEVDTSPGPSMPNEAEDEVNHDGIAGPTVPGEFGPVETPECALPARAVQIVVTNQSFAVPTVHLTIAVDGAIIADDDYEVGDQHNVSTYDLSLDPGRHDLKIESTDASGNPVTDESTFNLGSEIGGYVAISYDEVSGVIVDLFSDFCGIS